MRRLLPAELLHEVREPGEVHEEAREAATHKLLIQQTLLCQHTAGRVQRCHTGDPTFLTNQKVGYLLYATAALPLAAGYHSSKQTSDAEAPPLRAKTVGD